MNYKTEIIKTLSSVIDIEEDLIEIPPDEKLGDFAVPCFKLAKEFKKNPVIIAKEIAESINFNQEIFSKIENLGPYLNFYLNKTNFIKNILKKIKKEKNHYGSSDIGKNQTILVDFSSPNIAKPFGIAHLRSTVIGNAICNLYSQLGYKLIRINHLGDWGTQFGKLMVAYLKWGNHKRLEQEGIDYLVEIYIEFGKKVNKDPKLNEEARVWFKNLEEGHPEAVKLWENFRNLSLKEFKDYYDQLNINFDHYHGEAFYNDKLKETIEFVKKKIHTIISDGATIVNLEAKGIKTPLILLKSDGASTYHTRDIAAALYRIEKFSPKKIIYVVGTPQILHFQQLFAILNMLGCNHDIFTHVNFGNMSYQGKMMSTRHGNFIPLSEVIKKATKIALQIIEEKNSDLKNKEEIAKVIGIGAIIFGDLSNERSRDIEFTWEKAITFNGETSPYIQYTYARICSIIRKANTLIPDKFDAKLLKEDIEFELVKIMSQFPNIVKKSADEYQPYLLATFLITLAQKFNNFYRFCPIIKESPKLRDARLVLSDSARIILKKGLNILGIQELEEM